MQLSLILVLLLAFALAVALWVAMTERRRRMTLTNLLHRVISTDSQPPFHVEDDDASDDPAHA
ncbi:hypothetical protein [Crateriforma conspicua]|uniref:Uncharacterized protein n=1 Tax=Crateriforma conspicua TaxID=2527996 RepID=A0A5C6FPV2_9PLAN|nr:hypothetical protein V7x_42510 [Crateriforma conspicua]